MISEDQRKELALIIISTASYYGRQFERSVISMMIDDLKDLSFSEITNAYSVYRRDPKNSAFPLPAKIREIINPTASSRDLANTMARKIDKAISKFGWNWEHGQSVNGEIYFEGGGRYHWTFKEAVIAELGEIGYHTIASRGGWLSVRNASNEMDEGQFIAQMRDQIESSYNLQRQGIDITQIEMPKGNVQEIGFNNESNVHKLTMLKEIPK